MTELEQARLDEAARRAYEEALGADPAEVAERIEEEKFRARLATGEATVEDKIFLATGVKVRFGGGRYLTEVAEGVYQAAIWAQEPVNPELLREREATTSIEIDGQTWVRLVPSLPESRRVGLEPPELASERRRSGWVLPAILVLAAGAAYLWWRR